MTYCDEVLDLFIDDISLKLNMDFSWISQQPNEKLRDVSKHYQKVLKEDIKNQIIGHNLNNNLSDATDLLINYIDQDLTYEDIKQSVIQNMLDNNENLSIPLAYFEKARELWENYAELGDLDAQLILKKIIAGQISKRMVSVKGNWLETIVITLSDEEKAKINIKKIADQFSIDDVNFGKGQVITKEVIKESNLTLNQAITFMVGRCVVEIRQAWKDPSVDISIRLQNIITDIKKEFKDIFERSLNNLSKSVMNYISGLVANFYKNINQSIQKGGVHFKILCDEVWAFIKGENRSLLQTIVNISKAIAGLAILALIIGLHQYLISMGIPEVFVIIITGLVSSLVTVAIFRLIEKAAQLTSSVFYTRDIAKIRCEEVERICAEVLPLIEEKVEQLDILIEQEDQEREKVFNRSFIQIKESLNCNDVDKIILAYQELYQYLGKDLPFKNEKEFDDFILANNIFKI